MASLRVSPPWVTYVNELVQMFLNDPEVHVVYDNDHKEVKLYVDSAEKAGALMHLLPAEKIYGNVSLAITIVPANGALCPDGNLYQAALNGNDAFSFIKVIKDIFPNDLTYVVFKNKVVQYFNDNLGDVYGQCSTLYQEIAKDIFEKQEGVFFCTDSKKSLKSTFDTSLGQWP